VAPGIAGTFGVTKRPDGSQQVTFNGFPLYTFSHDSAPGQTNGQGLHAFGGIWTVQTAEAPIALAAYPVEHLTVAISASSRRVYGRVSVQYTDRGRQVTHLCAQAACSYTLPYGTDVRLTQVAAPTSSRTFAGWRIHDTEAQGRAFRSKKVSATVRMTSNYRVKALYSRAVN
jgi:hypothetical protein